MGLLSRYCFGMPIFILAVEAEDAARIVVMGAKVVMEPTAISDALEPLALLVRPSRPGLLATGTEGPAPTAEASDPRRLR